MNKEKTKTRVLGVYLSVVVVFVSSIWFAAYTRYNSYVVPIAQIQRIKHTSQAPAAILGLDVEKATCGQLIGAFQKDGYHIQKNFNVIFLHEKPSPFMVSPSCGSGPGERRLMPSPGVDQPFVSIGYNGGGHITYVKYTFIGPNVMSSIRKQLITHNGRPIYKSSGILALEPSVRVWRTVNDYLVILNESNASLLYRSYAQTAKPL